MGKAEKFCNLPKIVQNYCTAILCEVLFKDYLHYFCLEESFNLPNATQFSDSLFSASKYSVFLLFNIFSQLKTENKKQYISQLA